MKTCSVDECDRSTRAKGLCSTHYNRTHQPNRHAKADVSCTACGRPISKFPAGDRKPVCSYRCRYRIQFGRWPEDGKQLVGPVRVDKPTAAQVSAVAGDRLRFIGIECAWCGTRFLQDLRTTGIVARFCTAHCSKRSHEHDRRLKQGRFTVSRRQRLALYERDAWTCQLCHLAVDPLLPPSHPWAATLDHIECQSWTLIPDHSPSNLRLAHRMCNSLRGDRRDISPAA